MSRTTTLLASLLMTLAACAPTSEDAELLEDEALLESAEPETDYSQPLREQDGVDIPAAIFERAEDPERLQQIEKIHGQACSQERRAEAPVDIAPIERPRGITEPRFRLNDDYADQAEASLDLQVESTEDDLPVVVDDREPLIDAQERFLDEAAAIEARAVGSDDERADARAELKARMLDEA